MQSEQFRDEMIASLKEFAGSDGDQDAIQWFCERTFYTGGDFNDDKQLFSDLCDVINQAKQKFEIP
ncbi:hypothetical protein OFC24_32295, partial [Escherichia coli]|nr:hypothetical protein [Escherichia coli]